MEVLATKPQSFPSIDAHTRIDMNILTRLYRVLIDWYQYGVPSINPQKDMREEAIEFLSEFGQSKEFDPSFSPHAYKKMLRAARHWGGKSLEKYCQEFVSSKDGSFWV